MFRRVGLHPGPEFGVPAAAAVAELNVTQAYQNLEALADLHLIEPVGPNALPMSRSLARLRFPPRRTGRPSW